MATPPPLVVIVTGSNRGVGKAIVELLAQQKLDQPLIIYATARSACEIGEESLGDNKIRYRNLDIADASSIKEFFKATLNEVSSIHVLINNAAISHDHRETPALAGETIWNNYGGTRDMCKEFLSQPQLKAGARIVNTTSGLNPLSGYDIRIQDGFRSATEVKHLDAMAEAFLDTKEHGEAAQSHPGWSSGNRSYKVSKALINALTVLLAKQNPKVLINSCCPGWNDTEMGRTANGKPPKTPGEGARIPVRLAIGHLGQEGDLDGALGHDTPHRTGLFFENDSIGERGWGKGKSWFET